jgi:hypothetical protein
MIIIDYPPGGLGNFAAQVVTNTVINSGDPSFHKNPRAYDIQLVQPSQADFLNCLAQWQPKYPVAICHSYGAAAEIKKRVDCRIISIQPVDNWLQLHVNKELKAVPQGRPVQNSYEWYYYAPLSLKTTWAYPVVDELVNFDNFYLGPAEFDHNIQQLNPSAPSELLYRIFNQTQQAVTDHLVALRARAHSGQDTQGLNIRDRAIVDLLRNSQPHPL